jgi:hypothetical protein
MMTIFSRVFLCCLIATLSAAAVEAQGGRPVRRPPGELVAAFVRDNAKVGRAPSMATVELTSVLLGRADYPSANLDSVLEGLERVALTGTSSSLRAEAALSLSLPGSRRALRPRSGTVARLERIYRRSDNPEVRGAIIAGLAHSVEQARALAFLEDVATEEPADYPGAALDALAAISAHEKQGSGVLKRLHETGVVHDQHARQWLDLVASRGYVIR